MFAFTSMGAEKYYSEFKANFQSKPCDKETHYLVSLLCKGHLQTLKCDFNSELHLFVSIFFFFWVLPHTFNLLLCRGTLLCGCHIECTTRCCLCHNVFLITIPEVRRQQAASNPLCITCFPSSLNSWEGRWHQSLLTSHAVKHLLHQLLRPSQPLYVQQSQAEASHLTDLIFWFYK